MEFSFPIVVQESKRRSGRGKRFDLWPLFQPEVKASGSDLASALRKLHVAIRKEISRLGRDGDTDGLIRWAWNPKASWSPPARAARSGSV